MVLAWGWNNRKEDRFSFRYHKTKNTFRLMTLMRKNFAHAVNLTVVKNAKIPQLWLRVLAWLKIIQSYYSFMSYYFEYWLVGPSLDYQLHFDNPRSEILSTPLVSASVGATTSIPHFRHFLWYYTYESQEYKTYNLSLKLISSSYWKIDLSFHVSYFMIWFET